jgi:pyruvate formate lyase activating enzyme
MLNEELPLICDIKQNSLDDGPGIRTVLFFKGCPLACAWCQNPEAQESYQELVFQPGKCIACKDCVSCAAGAITYPPVGLDRDACIMSMACVDACPASVFKPAGTHHDIDAIMTIARQNKIFYANSGGGITLSGGDPMLFPDYVIDLVNSLVAENIGIVLETCGYFKLSTQERAILGNMQLIYYDVKLIDDQLHEQHTGVHNGLILKNLETLVREGAVILPDSKAMLDFKKNAYDKPLLLPRIPLVPGITDTTENLKAAAELFSSLGIVFIDVLPYNPLGIKKAEALGMSIKYNVTTWMDKDQLAGVRETLRGFQFDKFK